MERPLDGVLRRLVAQHRHRGVDVGAAARLHRDVEELAGDDLGAAQVEDVERRRHRGDRQAAAAQQLVGPAQQQVAEQDGAGGAVLLRVAAPARRRCSASNARWVAGRPRRVSEASMKSSWTSALACSSSSEAQARARASVVGRRGDGAVAPVAERRAEPLAAGDRRPGLRDQPLGVRPERREPRGLVVEELVEHRLDAVAEGRQVPGRAHGPDPRSASQVAVTDSGGRTPLADNRAHDHGTRAQHRASCSEQGERSFSFEFFPPKDEAGEEQLWHAITELSPTARRSCR